VRTLALCLIAALLGVGVAWGALTLRSAVAVVERRSRERDDSLLRYIRAAHGRLDALHEHARALQFDLESAHSRIEALSGQLDMVARTCPGRARPPRPLMQPKPRYPIPLLGGIERATGATQVALSRTRSWKVPK
jgi:hypothetical protein